MMASRQPDQPAVWFNSPQETLSPLPADDPVIAAIDEPDGCLVVLNHPADDARMRPKTTHDGPPDVQQRGDGFLVDVVQREFIDAGFPQPQPVAEPQHPEK